MSKSSLTLTLPVDAAVGSLRAAVDEGLRLLGLGLRAKLQPAFFEAWGPDWHREFQLRREQRKIYPGDASVLLKEFRFGDSPCHQAFNGISLFYEANRCIDVRNGLYHFRTDRYGCTQALQDLTALLGFARKAELSCENEIAELIRAVDAIKLNGPSVPVTVQEFAELKHQFDSVSDLYAESQRRSEEYEQSVEASTGRTEAAEVLLSESQDRENDLRRQLATVGVIAADRVELTRELKEAHKAVAAHEAAIRKSADEAAGAREALAAERAKRLVVESQLEDARVEATVRAVAGGRQADADPALVFARQELLDAVNKQILGVSPEEATMALLPASAARSALPPGSSWPGGRGDAVWTLSKASRDLYENSSSRLITDLVGQIRGRQVIDAFLSIRPSGGRVWMDGRGECTTSIADILVYLGNVFGDAIGGHDPAPGTVISGGPGGTRYILRQRDLEELSSGRRLSSHTGPDAAAAVATRLRIGRHEGGRIWVGADGLVTTRKGDAHVFLGRVSVEEWFGPFNPTSLAG